LWSLWPFTRPPDSRWTGIQREALPVGQAEREIFDKAVEADSIEKKRDRLKAIEEELAKVKQDLTTAPDDDTKCELVVRQEKLTRLKQHVTERIERDEEHLDEVK